MPALLAAAWRPPSRAITIPKVNFTDTRLKNGLRVIISPDRAAPVVSVAVAYNVGSRNERPGRTGFAHLFEHLMFKGSENVADGELAGLIENYGGNHNGQTDKDHTIYFEQVPSNQLDMVLFLEADRMRSPAITKENVDNQREAVKEERRLRVDNQPYGKTSETIAELAFENFANKHSIIGSMADLDAASLEDFTAFFKTYYAPNNAVLAIAGDVDPRRWRWRRSGNISTAFRPGPPPPPLDTAEPPQKEERRVELQDPLARLTLVDVGVSGAWRPEPRHGCAQRACVDSRDGPQLAAVRQPRAAAADRRAGLHRDAVRAKGPGLFYLEAHGCARQAILRMSRRRCTPRSRRSRRGRFRTGSSRRRATPRGAAWSATCAARCSARFCSRATRLLRRSRRHQHALRAHRVLEDRGRAARGAAVPRARRTGRSSITTPAPKPGAREGGCANERTMRRLCSLPCSWPSPRARCSRRRPRRAAPAVRGAADSRASAGQQRSPEDQAAAGAGGRTSRTARI